MTPPARLPAASAAHLDSGGGGEEDDMIDKGGDKHRDKEQEKRDTDGQRPIDPDTVREPKPGKRGK